MIDAPTLIGQIIGGVISVAVASVALFVALVNRRVPSTADDQARVETGIRILENQLARAEKAEERWLKVEDYLRGQLDKADERDRTQEKELEELRTERAELLALLRDARLQITEITAERDAVRLRLQALARKYALGEPITLADILGDDAPDPLDELEQTFTTTKE